MAIPRFSEESAHEICDLRWSLLQEEAKKGRQARQLSVDSVKQWLSRNREAVGIAATVAGGLAAMAQIIVSLLRAS